EADRLLATLDPLASLAEPDPDALARLLGGVEAYGPLASLLDELRRSARLPAGLLRDPEDIPSLPATPRTRPGDLWALGEHRLLCADARRPESLARVMAGGLADALWTDPPYGVSYQGKTTRRMRIAGDDGPGVTALLAEAFAAADAVLRPGAAIYVAHPAGAHSVTFGER